ncbi:methyltransferase [Halobacteriales archaeon SW_7_68_16]|nr:MAG: methyltransferase [Halobacteriales archaeon SW_7_68_16]
MTDDLAKRRGIETEVYQPAADSRLLARTAVDRLADRSGLALDVGTGSGYVAARLADGTALSVVGCDRNPMACRTAREAGIETVRADLVAPFRDDAFDAVVFNPPYLPAAGMADRDDWMRTALTGGEDGRAVVDPFVDAVGRVLAPDGVTYLLVSTLTGVDAVRERAHGAGLDTAVVAEESHPFETLVVLAVHP